MHHIGAFVFSAVVLAACGEKLPEPTATGTKVIDWSRPRSGTGPITIGEPAGDALVYRYGVTFTPDEGRTFDPEAGTASLELEVERRAYDIEGHSAHPVWVPDRVVVTVRDAAQWVIAEDTSPPFDFHTSGVHAGEAPFRFHIPATCTITFERGSRQGALTLVIAGHSHVQVVPAFGEAELQPLQIPAPPEEPAEEAAEAAPDAALLDATNAYVRANSAEGFEFDLEVQAVEGDFARIFVRPQQPGDGATVFMHRTENGWTGMDMGTAISCADLRAGGMPESLCVGIDP
jgi:hypothetical protein